MQNSFLLKKINVYICREQIKQAIMNKKFKTRLTEYLDSECSDYGLSYRYEWEEDSESVEAYVNNEDYATSVTFKYNEESDNLLIELSVDNFVETRECDETVKYFWMLIAPKLFK